jgi:DNA polymerase-3 subunit beta
MKFYINKETLLTPLQQIVSVIEKRQTMPILANVLLKIEQNELILTGTDLEIQIVSKTVLDECQSGEITVPARKFLDICRLLPPEATIKFELKEDKVKISSGRSRFSLSTLKAADYPEFSEDEMKYEFSINSKQLKKALDKTVFCMANQDVRYYLNGLMLNISNNTIKIVASDGHRLSLYEYKIDQETGYEEQIILPRKGIIELSRLLEDRDLELNFQFSKNNVKIIIDNIVFSAKLIDAKYPDFNKVFHQEFFNQIQVQRQLLKDALNRVAILANEKFKGISFRVDTKRLLISTHNPEHEQAEEELLIEYRGEPLEIAFNAQYFLDAVNNLDSELAILTIADNASSCFIEEPEKQPYKFIVMPMRM